MTAVRIPRTTAGILIFLVVFAFHTASPIITSFDSKWSVLTALSVIEEGNTDLNEYHAWLARHDYWKVVRSGDRMYSLYPRGGPLLAVPVVAALRIYFPRETVIRYSGEIERFTASACVAGATVFVWSIARFSTTGAGALLVAFIFAFCTSAWSVASRALWQHGPSLLVLSAALYGILKARERPALFGLASLPLAASIVFRPTNVIPIVFLTGYVWVKHRGSFFRFIAVPLTLVIGYAAFAAAAGTRLLPVYYSGAPTAAFPEIAAALAGNLVSPSRGLLVFSPILIAALWGMWLKHQGGEWDSLDTAIVFILLSHWLLISSVQVWWAGHSYGPRYWIEMLPFLCYYLGPAFKAIGEMRGRKRAAVALIVAVSIVTSHLIHARGAFDWDVYVWNSGPRNVDEYPERVWDWTDAQFLRGLTGRHSAWADQGKGYRKPAEVVSKTGSDGGSPNAIVDGIVPSEGTGLAVKDGLILNSDTGSVVFRVPHGTLNGLVVAADHNDTYLVECSPDGLTFRKLGTVPAVIVLHKLNGWVDLGSRTREFFFDGAIACRYVRLSPVPYRYGDDRYEIAEVRLIVPK